MEIVKISKSPFTDLYKIHLENGLDLSISATTISSYRLYKGKDLSDVDVEKLKLESTKDRLNEYAIRSLQRNSRTSFDLRKKLKEKVRLLNIQVPPVLIETIINDIISYLEKQNLLNDQEYAKNYIDARIHARKGISTWELINKLRLKGIDHEILNVIKETYQENDDENLIRAAKQKYEILKLRETDSLILKQKLYRFLIGKGFRLKMPIEQLIAILTDTLT